MNDEIQSLTNSFSDGNEITVWFPQDRAATIELLTNPAPFEQYELHLVPVAAQCWNLLASDGGTRDYDSLQIGHDCPKCHGSIVKFLSSRPFRHSIAHCHCLASIWLPESVWSSFIDQAPSWTPLWDLLLTKIDQSLAAYGSKGSGRE
jgi:hypothetical protein